MPAQGLPEARHRVAQGQMELPALGVGMAAAAVRLSTPEPAAMEETAGIPAAVAAVVVPLGTGLAALVAMVPQDEFALLLISEVGND
jgi:hypothetical protein